MRSVRTLHEENYKILLKYIKYDLNGSKYCVSTEGSLVLSECQNLSNNMFNTTPIESPTYFFE